MTLPQDYVPRDAPAIVHELVSQISDRWDRVGPCHMPHTLRLHPADCQDAAIYFTPRGNVAVTIETDWGAFALRPDPEQERGTVRFAEGTE
jgi:hypothetical protein